MDIVTQDTKFDHGRALEHDKASSLVALKGNWIVYSEKNYKGDSIIICEGERICNVGKAMNDRISSAKYFETCPN